MIFFLVLIFIGQLIATYPWNKSSGKYENKSNGKYENKSNGKYENKSKENREGIQKRKKKKKKEGIY